MNNHLKGFISCLCMSIFILLVSCGSENTHEPTIEDIPVYPDSVPGTSMQDSLLKKYGGAIRQYTTEDGYDEVLSYYRSQLAQYDPREKVKKINNFQIAALSMRTSNGGITVSIQENQQQSNVLITFFEIAKPY